MAKTLVLSNSKTNTFLRCRKKYEFKYVMDLVPKKKARPLELGSWVHALLEAYYKGKDWKKVHRKRTLQFNTLFEEEREELGDVPRDAARMMNSYLWQYRKEDRGLKVLATELDETIALPNGMAFRLIIDLVVEDRSGNVWLWDHKNVKKFMPEDFMLLDAQLTRYFWGAHKLGIEAHGVMFNELRTKAPTVPKRLQSGRLSLAQKIDTDFFTYVSAIRRNKEDPNDPHYRKMLRRLKAQEDRFFRRTHLPRDLPVIRTQMRELLQTGRDIQHTVESGHFQRTPIKSCVWDCPYLDPCMVELQGGNIAPIIKRNFEKRNDKETS